MSQKKFDIFARHGVKVYNDWDVVPSREVVLVHRDYSGELRLSRGATAPHTTEEGYDATVYRNGIPVHKDQNTDFAPYIARGRRSKPGSLFQLYLSETLIRRSHTDKIEALKSARWSVDLPESAPVGQEDAAEAQRAKVEAALFGVEAGWSQFLQDWSLAWICGFALFELIDNPDGSIRKLALRQPWTLKSWILDEDERDWIGAELEADGKEPVIVEREHLQLFRWDAFGDDLEGNSPVRTAAMWVEIKQLASRLEALAAEVRGIGLMAAESDADNPMDQAEAETLRDYLEAMTAAENPIIVMPNGRRLVLHSPAGTVPDFNVIKRYADEQIALAVKAENVLLGMGDVGTMGHAVVKDEQQIRSIESYARHICEGVNRIIRRMVDLMGGPVVEGLYPELEYGPQSQARAPEHYDRLATFVEKGMLTWTRDDEQTLREELKLAPLPDSEVTAADKKTAGITESLGGGNWSFSRGCGCGREHGKERLRFAKDLDVERVKKWLLESEGRLGQALRKEALAHREMYVLRTRGVTNPAQLMTIGERVRATMLPQYENAVRGEIRRIVVKGSATLLYDLGIIKTLPRLTVDGDRAVKRVPLRSQEFNDFVDGIAGQVARHAFNVTEHYLASNAMTELDPFTNELQRPTVPSVEAFSKTAAQYVGRPFNEGRELIMRSMQNRAAMLGYPAEIIAEYSSVLESNTCDECAEADGTRCVVGSAKYKELSPPNICEGGGRCRCMWNYIMPDEAGYEDILDELGIVWREGEKFTRLEERWGDIPMIYSLIKEWETAA